MASQGITYAAPAVQSGCAACSGSGSAGMTMGYTVGDSSYIAPSGTIVAAANAMIGQSYAPAMQAIVTAPETELVDCGPVESFKVVMVPDYITQTDYQPVTTYKQEIRQRTRVIPRKVPVEVEDYRTKTVMIPKTETKTVEYTVLVPQRQEKTVEIVETVPVWNEVAENYTVRVPTVVEVSEDYTVQVAQLRDEQFTYTVYVPQAQTITKMQTVTNAVPVTKTRTIQVSRPVTRTQTVTKDYGRWEVRVEEVAAPAVSYAAPAVSYSAAPSPVYASGGCGVGSSSCSGCGGCGQTYTTTASGCVASSTCGGCGGCGIAKRHRCRLFGGCGRKGGCSGGCGASSGYVVSSAPAMTTTIASAPAVSYSSGASYGSGGCGTVASVPATTTVSRRVWVPNVVTEEVPVTENISESQIVTYTAFEQQTEQIPYECTYLVYAPEQRTGTKKVVDYVPETRTRTRKVVEYNEETRTRTRKELSYKQETRTQTIPYVTYTNESRTKEVSYTINVPETQVETIVRTEYQTVDEEIVEDYSVRVPVTEYKEVQRQVCRMIPKLVPVTLYPCSQTGAQSIGTAIGSGAYGPAPVMGSGCSDCGGCSNCGGTPTMAPVIQYSAPAVISPEASAPIISGDTVISGGNCSCPKGDGSCVCPN